MSREVWDLPGKGSRGRIMCREVALYQLHPATPSRSTDRDNALAWSQLGRLF